MWGSPTWPLSLTAGGNGTARCGNDRRLHASMDGLEATRFIKKNWLHVKVIVLTMYPEQRAAALSAGADAFLLKGCQGEALIKTILS